MVITESEHASDSKSNPPSDPTSTTGTSQPAPPAYQIAPALPAPDFPSVPPQMPPTRPLVNLKEREPAWRRFFKAFCLAALIYLLLAVLLKSILHLSEKRIAVGIPAGPRKEDGSIIHCANNTSFFQMNHSQQSPVTFPPYSSAMSFSVPASSSLVFLLSRGSYGHGSVKLELSEKSGDSIEIAVVMSYYNNAARSSAKVCLLEREEGGRGVGIFTPSRIFPQVPGTTDQIKFDITIRFPKSGSSTNPLVINALETKMGIWSHYATSLKDRVVFKSLSFQASNSLIRVESISADIAEFKTSNSAITGSYNTSGYLSLITSNAYITASIRMENSDGHKPTHLEMKTSNGRIQTPITLVSTDKPSTYAPAFSVSAKTSNSPLAITFPEAPSSPFSTLTLVGKTSNSAANVKLHPTYEGTILLKTSNSNSELVQQRGTTDPSGKNRHRNVEIRKLVKGTLEGGVWWGNDPNKDEGKGDVKVTTSNARNVVELG